MNLYNNDFKKAKDKYLTAKHKFILNCYYKLPYSLKSFFKKIIDSKILKKFW